VIVDLAATSAIGADALATLMNLQRSASRQEGELILTGLTPRLQKILRLSQAGTQFHTVSEVLEALADGPTSAAQVSLELGDESVVCRLEGEICGSRARAVLEVCDQLSRSFADVRIDTVGLTETSRALFAGLSPSSSGKARAASMA
jgi:anti-anti-sigma regulatory factor